MPIRSLSFQIVWLLTTALTVFLLSGCKVPEDPEGTTKEVIGGVLKVGALTQTLDDVDADAVALIAEALQAEPELATADPHTLFAQLEDGKIHLVAGRIPANTPFAADVALTDPVGHLVLGEDSEDRVLAIRKGENRFLIVVNRAIRGPMK